MSSLYLPNEILREICEKLGEDEDYSTLFSCARVSVAFAQPALRAMYKIGPQNKEFAGTLCCFTRRTSVKDRNPSDPRYGTHVSIWRSILRSTLGLTYLPYSSFVRSLDVDSLIALLFSANSNEARNQLYEGDLAQFWGEIVSITGGADIAQQFSGNLDVVWTLVWAIVDKTPKLECFQGPIPSEFVKELLAKLPMLKALGTGRVETLSGVELDACCRNLKSLKIEETIGSNKNTSVDLMLSKILRSASKIEEVSLEYAPGASKQTFLALSHQALQLTSLKVWGLTQEAIKSLAILKPCVGLESLTLAGDLGLKVIWSEDEAPTDEIAEWLNSCPRLKKLRLYLIAQAVDILNETLTMQNYSLESLSLCEHGEMDDDYLDVVCAGIVHHPMLEEIELEAMGAYEISATQLRNLMHTLGSLPRLRRLHLDFGSDAFTDDILIRLIVAMPQLEVLVLEASALTHSVLAEIPNLKNLKMIELIDFRYTEFDELKDFISQFCPVHHRGLTMSFPEVGFDLGYTEEEECDLDTWIREHLGGRFTVKTLRRTCESYQEGAREYLGLGDLGNQDPILVSDSDSDSDY